MAAAMPDYGIPIILLAAGGSTRFGSPKLEYEIGGQRLIDWSVQNALQGQLGKVFVVTREGHSFSGLPRGVEQISNANYQEGLSSSIRCAASYLEGVKAGIFQPADQPLIGPTAYTRLAARFSSGSAIVVATYSAAPMNPVLISKSKWSLLEQATGDSGLRSVIGGCAYSPVECGDIASVCDIDTPEDVDKLLATLAEPVRNHCDGP